MFLSLFPVNLPMLTHGYFFLSIISFAEVDPKYLEYEWISHLIDILTYHVTPGNVTSSMLSLGATVDMVNMESAEITSLTPPMINQATITGPDIFADNGVVHVIDSVLLPASATSNIVDVVTSTPQLSMLANLVVVGGLASTLAGEGPFTVFAPTNEGKTIAEPVLSCMLIDLFFFISFSSFLSLLS